MKVYSNEEFIVITDKNYIITYDLLSGEDGISLYEDNKFVKNIEIEDIHPDLYKEMEKGEEIINSGNSLEIEDLSNELSDLLQL